MTSQDEPPGIRISQEEYGADSRTLTSGQSQDQEAKQLSNVANSVVRTMISHEVQSAHSPNECFFDWLLRRAHAFGRFLHLETRLIAYGDGERHGMAGKR